MSWLPPGIASAASGANPAYRLPPSSVEALAANKAAAMTAIQSLTPAPPPPTQAISAPEGQYSLVATIHPDPKAYVGWTAAERDTPVRLAVLVHPNVGVSEKVPLSPGGFASLSRSRSAMSFSSDSNLNGLPVGVSGGDFSTVSTTVPMSPVMLSLRRGSAGFADVNGPLVPSSSHPGGDYGNQTNPGGGEKSSRLGGLFGTVSRRGNKAKSIIGKSGSTFVARLQALDNLPVVLRDCTQASVPLVLHNLGDSTFNPTPPPSTATTTTTSTAAFPPSPPHPAPSTTSSSSSSAVTGTAAPATDTATAAPEAATVVKEKKRGFFSRSSSKSNVHAASSSSLAAPTHHSASSGSLAAIADAPLNVTAAAPAPTVHSWLTMTLGRSFLWMDEADRTTIISRLHLVRAIPTCMAINRHTLATDRLDVLLGFSTGDILWYDAVHHKYNRLNKTHALHNKAVTQVAWVPGSECLFVASFSDGVVLVLDKDREDREMEPTAGKETTPSKEKSLDASLVVDELVEQRAAEGFEVFKPRKAHKHNPVSCWRIGQFVYGTGRSVSDVAFSPDGMHVALASLGGSLRVVHFAEERIMDTYKSFYGGLLCVTWSPDGKLIVTGGQDDLISVYSLKERRLIARCRGHTSWVSQIAFDVWRCDSRNYRFGSVGQDGKLLFWDFPVKGHSRMGKIPASTMRSASFTDTMRARAMSGGSVAGPTAAQPGKPEHLVHPALAACESLIMEPIMSETISALPLWSLVFTPDAALVAEKRGRVLVWERPKVTAYSGHSFAGQAQA